MKRKAKRNKMSNNNTRKFDLIPTPFLDQTDPDVNKQMKAIDYDVNQFVSAGFILDCRGLKSSFSDVLNALSELWQNQSVDIYESREEHAICAIHGWTLAEFYSVLEEMNVNSSSMS